MSYISNTYNDAPIVLTVPGLGGSGPSHWQTLWEEARLDTRRVELGMWQTPHRNAWSPAATTPGYRRNAPTALRSIGGAILSTPGRKGI